MGGVGRWVLVCLGWLLVLGMCCHCVSTLSPPASEHKDLPRCRHRRTPSPGRRPRLPQPQGNPRPHPNRNRNKQQRHHHKQPPVLLPLRRRSLPPLPLSPQTPIIIIAPGPRIIRIKFRHLVRRKRARRPDRNRRQHRWISRPANVLLTLPLPVAVLQHEFLIIGRLRMWRRRALAVERVVCQRRGGRVVVVGLAARGAVAVQVVPVDAGRRRRRRRRRVVGRGCCCRCCGGRGRGR